MSCANNINQLILACCNYETLNKIYPLNWGISVRRGTGRRYCRRV